MRKCPECGNHLPPGSVKFDKEHNVICTKCSNVVIAAVVTAERKIITTTIVQTYPYNQRHTSVHGHHGNPVSPYGDYGD